MKYKFVPPSIFYISMNKFLSYQETQKKFKSNMEHYLDLSKISGDAYENQKMWVG